MMLSIYVRERETLSFRFKWQPCRGVGPGRLVALILKRGETLLRAVGGAQRVSALLKSLVPGNLRFPPKGAPGTPSTQRVIMRLRVNVLKALNMVGNPIPPSCPFCSPGFLSPGSQAQSLLQPSVLCGLLPTSHGHKLSRHVNPLPSLSESQDVLVQHLPRWSLASSLI